MSRLDSRDGRRSLAVRIIEAEVAVTGTDGSRVADSYRLITTLTDHRRHPADTLIRLYHEQWEIESAYLALRCTLLDGRVLHSGDRPGAEQELWAPLTLYQLLRMAMVPAVETRPGTNPDRASFMTALQAAREELTAARGICPDRPAGLPGVIGRAVLATLLPAPPGQIDQAVEAATTAHARVFMVLAAVHAARPAQIRALQLGDADLGSRRLTIAGKTRPLDDLTYQVLLDWLTSRQARWPDTSNPHLLISRRTAPGTGPVSHAWLRSLRGLPATLDRVRIDRHLEEALTCGADPLHLNVVFGLDDTTGMRYAASPARSWNDLTRPAPAGDLQTARGRAGKPLTSARRTGPGERRGH